MKKVFSFDIYDTCITRNFAYPTDLFLELAHRVLQKKENITDSSVHILANFRIMAEKKARLANRPREDIQIDQIYEQFTELSQWGIKPQEMLEQELLLERQSISPILEMKHRIDKLRSQSQRIIFISNMYLPVDFIRQFLQEFDIATSQDGIYVSGEVGMSKHTGNLFKYVLEQEGILPKQLEHTGDNSRSDISAARKLGITAIHYTSSKLNHHEKKILATNNHNPKVISQIVGISKITRLINQSDIVNISSLVTGVIAPLLIAYTTWVLKKAKEQGVKRLYFVSRDGQLPFKIAQVLSKFMIVPECHYLYGSRQAWRLPSILKFEPDLIPWLITADKSTAPRDILARVNINPDEIADVLHQNHFPDDKLDTQLASNELTQFTELLYHNPVISALILEKAKQARRVTTAYFEQEGLLKDNQWAIVDVGWRLSCQSALKKILNAAGWNNEPRGYYLGIARDHVPTNDSGPFSAFILQDKHHHFTNSQHNWFFRRASVMVLEHAFLVANHPFVLGYHYHNNHVEPSFKKDQLFDSKLQQYIYCLHKTTIQYTKRITQTDILDKHLEVITDTALREVKNFMIYPQAKEVAHLAWLTAILDQSHDERHYYQLASYLSIMDIVRMIAHHLGVGSIIYNNTKHIWLEGSAALSHPVIRRLFYSLQFIKRSMD
jgi:predicted HAD superfamily hydrolase